MSVSKHHLPKNFPLVCQIANVAIILTRVTPRNQTYENVIGWCLNRNVRVIMLLTFSQSLAPGNQPLDNINFLRVSFSSHSFWRRHGGARTGGIWYHEGAEFLRDVSKRMIYLPGSSGVIISAKHRHWRLQFCRLPWGARMLKWDCRPFLTKVNNIGYEIQCLTIYVANIG